MHEHERKNDSSEALSSMTRDTEGREHRRTFSPDFVVEIVHIKRRVGRRHRSLWEKFTRNRATEWWEIRTTPNNRLYAQTWATTTIASLL